MKYLKFSLALLFVTLGFSACQSTPQTILKVYNWGEYIDTDVLTEFEAEYNVKIIYDTFDSNESMYNKLASGSVNYDVIFPSDYMIGKMITDDLLEPLDYSLIPNIKELTPELLHGDYDPKQQFSVPYFWGTVGILYDTTKVTQPVDTWNILWNQHYQNDILMYNSSRDSMMVALKKLGYSMNSTNPDEIAEATQALIMQKKLVFGYVGDEVITNMINSQAALAVVYSGDATTIMQENPNMAFALPQEGSNIWTDGMVIPKSATEKELAHTFINYMSRANIAYKNSEAVGYSTPNINALSLMQQDDVEYIDWLSYNPDLTKLEHMEFFQYADYQTAKRYNNAWEDVLAS